MRSIHTIKSGDQGKKDYYTKDESLKQNKDQKAYYSNGEAKSESEEMTQAIWFGKDAERLNLRGHGLQSDWEQIFDGYIPGTTDRIRYEKPREDHQENCIYDVVLSCKKSVSMQIHLGNDERLYKAYQETVKEIAELIEHDYAQARIQVNGDRRIVQTGGIIAMMIPHHTSRKMDMHVHAHLAIANGTYCEDGKWRSLLDRGFSHAYYMGDYFSVRMAARVQALGYEIRETVTEEGHPSWELAGYSDEQIKVFSKRSENAKVKELVAAGVSRDDALLRTRKAKNVEETLEEAQGRWKVEADAFEIEAITPLNRPVVPRLKATAEQVLESAIRHYSNRSNHFTRDQIREYAFKLNRTFTVADLDRASATHPELIDYGKLRDVDELKGHFTTAEAAEREIRTIKAWMQGQGQATPILDRLTASLSLENIQLKTGQRSAIMGVLASDNQHQIIHGLSGVGKTTALRQLKTLTDRQQIEVMGFAPSIDAAKKLSKELGIETHTVQSLVKKNFDLKPNQLLIVDEAGMVSAEMLDVVMQKANSAGARVLLVGDTGQNQAIEAGSPMRSLMKHGAEIHHIAEIIRQQNSIQKQAVELIARGNGLDALSLLNEHGYINPMPEQEQRIGALASEFLALSPEEQLNTLIVAGTNAEKDAITAEIRAGLKAEGRLGESRTIVQLRDRALTPEEAKQIAYYRVGDYIKFSRNYKRISERDYERTWLQKNVPYQVVGKDSNELIVSTAGGRRFRVNPSLMKDKQVFEGNEFDIAAGDSLRWTSSNKEKGQINGKTFKIAALNGDIATILTDDGLRQLDLNEALAVDYTLTSTSYRAQGSDRPRVFVSATNDPTSNREPFYVSISRQIKELKVWTDDYNGLKRRVAESSVQLNPLELIGDNYGKRPDEPDSSPAQGIEPEHSGVEAGEPRTQGIDERGTEHGANRSQGRDGGISDPVRGATGEPEALRDSGRDSGVDWDTQGLKRPSDELGTDAWRDEFAGELRSGRDQELHPEAAQQRLDESAANLRSRMERVISSLSVFGNDELVHDSSIVESTREVVEALEPIVSSLEGQSVATPPKRDLSSAMARVINGLTAVDSEKVFSDSAIVAEIKSLVSRVEAHTVAQEQLTQHINIGEHHVYQNSRESTRTTARRDSGVEHNGREYGQSRRDSDAERITADITASVGESVHLRSRNQSNASDYARPHAGADQAATQTNRGKERESTHRKGEPGYRRGTAPHRETEYRDVATQSRTARSEPGIGESAARVTPSSAADFGLSHELTGATDPLQALADAIVRIRLQRELAGPLAQYRSTLSELREVLKQNAQLQADIQQKSVTYTETQANVREVKATVAQKQATVADKLQQVLNQAKLEVLDTTLTEWRSLRQEPELELPEHAVTISDKVALSELIENYPAQKAIEFAMAEYAKTRDRVIDLRESVKTGVPVFKLEKMEHPTKTVEMPKLRVKRSEQIDKPKKHEIKPKPKKIETFWVPEYQESDRPHYIEPHHWKEMEKSAIHPELIRENIISISGQSVIERLLEHEFEKPKYGTGQEVTAPMIEKLNDYATLEKGGWWGSAGTDAKSLLTDKPQQSSSGVFKGDSPRIRVEPILKFKKSGHNYVSLKNGFTNVPWSLAKRSPDEHLRYKDYQDLLNAEVTIALLAADINPNKFIKYEKIKYENPAGTDRPIFLANVPPNLAQKIYAKHGITPTEEELEKNFWQVVRDRNLPIVLIEGDKKALAALSQGIIAVGTSGVALYKAHQKNEDGSKTKLDRRELIPEIAVFATPDRVITLANDQDPPTKIKTVWNVRRDTVRTAELLHEAGCDVRVAQWDHRKGKGADDLIANHGGAEFIKAIATAQSWHSEARIWYKAQYNNLSKKVVNEIGNSIHQKVIDCFVFKKAAKKGDAIDGYRALSQSAGVRAQGMDYAKAIASYVQREKVENGIKAVIATRPVAESIRQGVLMLIREPDCEFDSETETYIYTGDRWTFRMNVEALTVTRNKDNSICYQVKNGSVLNNTDEPALRQAMRSIFQTQYDEEPTQSIRAGRRR